MLPVPVTESDVTAEWLRSVLPRGGNASFRLAVPERIGEGYGLSSRIFRFRLTGGDEPSSVVVKLWDTTGPAGTREVRFFETFGPDPGLRTPVCHHGAVSEEAERGVLVLEDLGDVVQGDCLEMLGTGDVARVADGVAGLHAKWWRSPQLEQSDWLPSPPRMRRDADWMALRRRQFLERFPGRLGSFAASLLDGVETLYERAMRRLAGAPPTLLHDDLHLDNLVFDRDTGAPIVLDWARAAAGPAALDVAEMVFAMTAPENVQSVLDAYGRGLHDRSVHELDSRALLSQLGGALILHFITSTCGVVRWQPANERERRMIEAGLDRAERAVTAWCDRDPELFAL